MLKPEFFARQKIGHLCKALTIEHFNLTFFSNIVIFLSTKRTRMMGHEMPQMSFRESF